MKNLHKRIGTLMPLSSLAGKSSLADGMIFLDWLKKTKQSAWQLLPLHETQLEPLPSTRHVPSPYKSYGIGLDPAYLPASFSKIFPTEKQKQIFIEDQGDWIHDYALFCALRDFFKTDDWRTWDEDLKKRETDALALWTKRLAKEIDRCILVQWQLHRSYAKLRTKTKKLGIALIGDLPFYLSITSPLVWAHRKVFQLEADGDMRRVSGIPDSSASHFGRQVWGHPLYNWEKKYYKETVSLWELRLKYQATLFDTIRIDHARAIFSYGVIDRFHESADTNVEGPGEKFLKEILEYCRKQHLSIFVEDSGERLSPLRASLKKLGIPGIKILRFAFDEKREKINKEYAETTNYPVKTVAYTTTHDTESLLDYIYKLNTNQKHVLAQAVGVAYQSDDKIFAKLFRDRVLASPAYIIIIPIQDWLLTTERINIPGTELAVNEPNWRFHLNTPIEKLPTTF